MTTSSAPSIVVTAKQPALLGNVRVHRLKHPGRWVAVALIVVLFAFAIYTAFTNPRFRWDVVAEYLFSPPILDGLRITLTLTVIGMVMGVVLGTIVALMRLSENPVLKWAGFTFVWLVRGIPLLVQLIFWYNISALFPVLTIGIPFGGPTFASIDSNTVMNAWTAAVLGLGLNQAAYMAEIIRSGIQSVDEGQLEASSTIGLTRLQTVRRIVLPQAMRVILPPTGNETITMLKTTSLVSVVAVADLLYSTQLVYARTFQTIPMLIMASIWYLILISVLSIGQSYLERYYARGSSRHVHVGYLQRLRGRTQNARAITKEKAAHDSES
jgi:polar amino acid transport system permease protein